MKLVLPAHAVAALGAAVCATLLMAAACRESSGNDSSASTEGPSGGVSAGAPEPGAGAPSATAAAPFHPARSWTQPRVLRVARAGPGEDGPALELRYAPAEASGARERLALVVVEKAGAERTVWTAAPTPAQRDALWNSRWAVAVGPAVEGVRRIAISRDGGASWAVLRGPPGAEVLCPHESFAARGGAPDWSAVDADGRWAAEVLETAVWGCDAAGANCQSRSAVPQLPVHHSEAAADPLAAPRANELHAALAVAAKAPLDRTLAVAAVDAAVSHQAGLGEAELTALGQLAARGLAARGPLAPEERKALQLRVALATEEARKTPADQLSPRLSIEALRTATKGLPQAVGKGGAAK